MAALFHRLLLATEHTVYDGGAEMLAFALARHCGLGLTAVLPIVSNPEFEMVAPQLAARADAEAAVKRQSLDATARVQQVPLELVLRRGAEPFAEIVAEARERAADLLVIRRRGQRGLLANLLLGEMVHKVVSHAPCSVLIAPRGAALWRRGVLLGVDPRVARPAGVEQAAALALDQGLPLHLLCVADGQAARQQAERALAAALERARAAGAAPFGQVCTGRAHVELLRVAQETGADLLVVARRGDESLVHAWIGGTAQKVIGTAQCPVLVCVDPVAAPAAPH